MLERRLRREAAPRPEAPLTTANPRTTALLAPGISDRRLREQSAGCGKATLELLLRQRRTGARDGVVRDEDPREP